MSKEAWMQSRAKKRKKNIWIEARQKEKGQMEKKPWWHKKLTGDTKTDYKKRKYNKKYVIGAEKSGTKSYV